MCQGYKILYIIQNIIYYYMHFQLHNRLLKIKIYGELMTNEHIITKASNIGRVICQTRSILPTI